MENSAAHKNTGTLNSAKFELHHLPAYASFLLHEHLEDFVKELLRHSREEEMPLLKYFMTFSETQMLEMAKISNTSLLSMLAENRLKEYIDNATSDYIQNRLPAIDRQEVLAEDITVVSLVRRKTFRNLLHFYTSDSEVFINIMQEVDRFTATTEAALFNAYLNVQQEKIKEINQDLAYQKEELLEAQRLAQMGSFFWDMKEGNSTYTPGALAIFGLSEPTSLAGFFEYVHPADKDKLKLAIETAMKDEGLYECEYSYIKDKVEKRIWSRGNVSFENGIPVSMRGTIIDMTTEHKLLGRLQQSEALHNQAQALTHIGNWSWSPGGESIIWSDEMYRIHGLEPQSETISFDRFMAFTHPDQREHRLQQIQESLRTGEAEDYYLQIITDAGVLKMLKGKGEIQAGADGTTLQANGTCQDVTKEYLLNKDLQEKEQNFQQLIFNAPDAVIVIDRNSIVTLWNPKTEEIFGFTAEEVMGKHLSGIIIPERYREAHEKGMQRFLDTGQSTVLNKTLELMACNKAQEEFHISLTISETRQGHLTSFIAFIRDISQQKNTQLELQHNSTMLEFKNMELERINKELESFNFAASHDLQEPLRKIQTYGSRILANAGQALPEKITADLDKIMTASARMQNLIADLLSFSQNTVTSQQAEPVNLNQLLEEVKNIFINDVEEKRVKLIISDLPVVKVVPFQFLQLFMNLLSNAIKYQEENVAPVIHISQALIHHNDIPFKGIFPAENYLLISVADNGIGFEEEYADKIFELFTRLHGRHVYSGTGIGLATCKKIVHNHNGFIKAESVLGKGSTFKIYLPEDCIVKE